MNPFDGLDQVNASEERPPAVAGLFHESETFKPMTGSARRPVATEMAPVDLEVQQFQPVPETREADEFGVRRQEVGPGQFSDALAQSPQACRIEPADDDLTFRYQDTVHFPEDHVRVFRKFESMGQDDQVHGFVCKGQTVDIMDEGQLDGTVRRCGRGRFGKELVADPAVFDPVVFQGIDFGKTDLEGVEAENVGRQCLEKVFFPFKHVASNRCHQPVVHDLDFYLGFRRFHKACMCIRYDEAVCPVS